MDITKFQLTWAHDRFIQKKKLQMIKFEEKPYIPLDSLFAFEDDIFQGFVQ